MTEKSKLLRFAELIIVQERDGKQLQYNLGQSSTSIGASNWANRKIVTKTTIDPERWRITPEPKYRPFKPEEVRY